MSDSETTFTLEYENRIEPLLTAALVYDHKRAGNRRRAIHLLGGGFVLFLAIQNLFSAPTSVVSWLFLLVAAGFGWFVWTDPPRTNRKFAEHKCTHAPHVTLTFDGEGFTVDEHPGVQRVGYDDGVQVWEYEGVYAVCFDKGRLLAIEQAQLDEAAHERLRGIFTRTLPDRFEQVSPIKKMI